MKSCNFFSLNFFVKYPTVTYPAGTPWPWPWVPHLPCLAYLNICKPSFILINIQKLNLVIIAFLSRRDILLKGTKMVHSRYFFSFKYIFLIFEPNKYILNQIVLAKIYILLKHIIWEGRN